MGYLVFGGCAAFVKSEFIRTFAAVCCGLCPWFAVQVRKNETKKKRGGVVGLGALFLSKKSCIFAAFVVRSCQKTAHGKHAKSAAKNRVFCIFVANLL